MNDPEFPKPRPHLRSITAYTAGRASGPAKRGGRRPLKLSSNEVLWGPSEEAVAALRREAGKVHVYPRSQPFELRSAIADFAGAAPENIVLGNGSNEIIQFVLQAYVWPRQHVLVPEKTFSMYRIYSEMAHLRVREAPNSPDFGIDLNAVKRRIRTATKVIFLANPNNPTGRVVDRMALELFLMGIKKNILVVIDEAYADFCDAGLRPDLVSLIRSGKYPNLVVLRTFSKSFGMAGLRLGYGIACEEVVRNLSAMAQPFNVNSLAAVAAKVSLEKRSHHHRIVRQTRQGRAFLEKKLDEMKIPFVPSQSNFVMLRVGNAAAAADFLEGRGILVRDLGSFGFPEHIRVTVALQEHNRRFLAALKEWCGSRAACRKED